MRWKLLCVITTIDQWHSRYFSISAENDMVVLVSEKMAADQFSVKNTFCHFYFWPLISYVPFSSKIRNVNLPKYVDKWIGLFPLYLCALTSALYSINSFATFSCPKLKRINQIRIDRNKFLSNSYQSKQ